MSATTVFPPSKRPSTYLKRARKMPAFLLKTRAMLDDGANMGAIISWNEAGNGLTIHNVRLLPCNLPCNLSCLLLFCVLLYL